MRRLKLLKRLTWAALSLSLAMTLISCQSDRVACPETSPTKSMKGYELYSWQMQGDWYFALVIGTNYAKSYDEISSPGVPVQGLEALKRKLDQLPRGEQIFWSDQRVPNTVLPPDELVEEVSVYC